MIQIPVVPPWIHPHRTPSSLANEIVRRRMFYLPSGDLHLTLGCLLTRVYRGSVSQPGQLPVSCLASGQWSDRLHHFLHFYAPGSIGRVGAVGPLTTRKSLHGPRSLPPLPRAPRNRASRHDRSGEAAGRSESFLYEVVERQGERKAASLRKSFCLPFRF